VGVDVFGDPGGGVPEESATAGSGAVESSPTPPAAARPATHRRLPSPLMRRPPITNLLTQHARGVPSNVDLERLEETIAVLADAYMLTALAQTNAGGQRRPNASVMVRAHAPVPDWGPEPGS
jgi:hypothetical protein